MIKLSVLCTTRLHFCDGQISGEIVIDPNGLLDCIINGTSLNYFQAERSSTSKLIYNKKSELAKNNLDYNIILLDGVVEKTYTLMTMHEAMDLLDLYLFSVIHNDVDVDKFHEEAVKDYLKFRDYIYRCDDCNCSADTANVEF